MWQTAVVAAVSGLVALSDVLWDWAPQPKFMIGAIGLLFGMAAVERLSVIRHRFAREEPGKVAALDGREMGRGRPTSTD